MKKRSKIKILGQWISLEHVSGLLDKEDCYGDSDSEKRLIRIEASLEGERYKRTLRHECMHMKLALSGLTELLDPKLEESLAVLAESD